MTRIDYYNDPNAPRANTIVPAASAIVTDQRGRILLHRRSDNQFWSIPGGTMEIGEAIRDTVIREVKEETGLDVEPQRLVGIYSNPNHVIAYPNGEVRQQFSICFACRLLGGRLTTGDESLGVGFFAPAQIEQIPVHPSVRLRIKHYLESWIRVSAAPIAGARAANASITRPGMRATIAFPTRTSASARTLSCLTGARS